MIKTLEKMLCGIQERPLRVLSEDERLASILFSGFIDTQKNGLPRQKFIRKGSKEERDCRKAVARLLRSGKPLTQDFAMAPLGYSTALGVAAGIMQEETPK